MATGSRQIYVPMPNGRENGMMKEHENMTQDDDFAAGKACI